MDILKDVTEAVTAFKTSAVSLEALLTQLHANGAKITLGQEIADGAQMVGKVATSIEGADSLVTDVGALAGAPGLAVAGAIEGAAPLVAAVANEVETLAQAGAPQGDPLTQVFGWFDIGDKLLAGFFGGKSDADTAAVNGAFETLKDVFAKHPDAVLPAQAAQSDIGAA